MSPLWLLAVPVAAIGGSLAARWRNRPSPRQQRPWRLPLLVLEVEVEGAAPPLPAAVVARAVAATCLLVPPGGALHVLGAVRVPLSVPLEAPPGEETEHMAALLQQVERLAGRSGVTVYSHLHRGRNVRTMLRETLGGLRADAVVLCGTLSRLAELMEAVGPAQAVLLPVSDELPGGIRSGGH